MTSVGLELLIRTLTGEAARSGRTFLVARNYQMLPGKNVGRDIDLLVPRRALCGWVGLVANACKKLGLAHYSIKKHRYCCRQVISGLNRGTLEIDLIPRLDWRGVEWLCMDQVVRRAVPFREGMWIPHPADECVITFCHSYLYGGHIKQKYVPSMAIFAKEHSRDVWNRLRRVFGMRIASEIVTGLQTQDVQILRRKAAKSTCSTTLLACWRSTSSNSMIWKMSKILTFFCSRVSSIASR